MKTGLFNYVTRNKQETNRKRKELHCYRETGIMIAGLLLSRKGQKIAALFPGRREGVFAMVEIIVQIVEILKTCDERQLRLIYQFIKGLKD